MTLGVGGKGKGLTVRRPSSVTAASIAEAVHEAAGDMFARPPLMSCSQRSSRLEILIMRNLWPRTAVAREKNMFCKKMIVHLPYPLQSINYAL